jgi:hypothetical protein
MSVKLRKYHVFFVESICAAGRPALWLAAVRGRRAKGTETRPKKLESLPLPPDHQSEERVMAKKKKKKMKK